MSEPPRLRAQFEAASLVRRVQAEGGFGAVLHKGEPDAGTLLVVLVHNGRGARAYERMPQPDGTRAWDCAKAEDESAPGTFAEYLARRAAQDPDLWIVELDVADGERFIGLPGRQS